MKKIIFCVIIFLILISLINLFSPIYNIFPICNRLENSSYFATIIYTVITGLTLILIFFSFQETQKQSFDSTFFKFIESHRSIINRLQQGKTAVVLEQFSESEKRENADKDFLDILYKLLDKKYKQNKSKTKVKERIDDFFKGNYYLIGNYVRNFFSIIKYVDKSRLLNTKQKKFYVTILRDISTTDDLRFLFYSILWKSEECEGREWKKLFDKYEIANFFGNNKDDLQLINSNDDWNTYQDIKIDKCNK